MKTIISQGFDAAIAAHGADPSRHGKVFAPGSAHDLGRTPSPLRVFVFDVGKGDCIVLSAGSSSVMIDTGYESTAASVVARLRAEGIGRLSAMIVTHYDRDHVDGIRSIGGAMGVDAIYLPGYVGSDKNYRSCVSATASLGVPTIRVTRELTLNLAQARLTVFPSVVTYVAGSGKVEGNDNDMSLVATLVHGRDSYLFAGDLEEEGIRAYLAAGHGGFDVLKMPHHGEYSPGISELLDDVRPKIAAITDSVSDAADKKTLKLLKSAGVRTYRTSVDGTIIIDSDGSGTYSVSSASDMSS